MAAELVETSRLWARDVAAIDPAWVEKLAKNLLKHNYSDPTWSRKRGSAVVTQRSTLYGVTVVADRTVPYHRVDPVAARDMFIRNALVDGDWTTHHNFFHDNKRKLAEASEYEEKARRRGLVVDEDTLFDFYDQRIPESVTTARHFDSWWKKQKNKHSLDFDPEALLEDDHDVTEDAFPDRWLKGSIDYDLSYKFEPGDPLDLSLIHISEPTRPY